MGKYYAFLGEESKIFTDWAECLEYMSDKKGYKYKSFRTMEEAEAFLNGENYYDNAIDSDVKNGYAVAYTDGSFSEEIGAYSYGVIAISPKSEKSEFSGVGNAKEFLSSRNIAGEVSGVLTAVKWAFINGYPRLKIYHDYIGLSEWAERRWDAKSPISIYYVGAFFRYARAVSVEFVKVKGHSNDKYNEEVDKIAKEALNSGKILPLSPLNVGFGVRIDDFGGYLKKLNKEAVKAKFCDTESGVRFSYNGEDCSVAQMNMGTVTVGGNGGALYSLAAVVAMEITEWDKRKAEWIISQGFETDFEFRNGYSGIEISDFLIENIGGENCAPYIIFALKDMETELKRVLNCKKISECFEYSDNAFHLKSEVENGDKILEIYELFYNYRVPFLNLKMTKKDATVFMRKVKEIL